MLNVGKPHCVSDRPTLALAGLQQTLANVSVLSSVVEKRTGNAKSRSPGVNVRTTGGRGVDKSTTIRSDGGQSLTKTTTKFVHGPGQGFFLDGAADAAAVTAASQFVPVVVPRLTVMIDVKKHRR